MYEEYGCPKCRRPMEPATTPLHGNDPKISGCSCGQGYRPLFRMEDTLVEQILGRWASKSAEFRQDPAAFIKDVVNPAFALEGKGRVQVTVEKENISVLKWLR